MARPHHDRHAGGRIVRWACVPAAIVCAAALFLPQAVGAGETAAGSSSSTPAPAQPSNAARSDTTASTTTPTTVESNPSPPASSSVTRTSAARTSQSGTSPAPAPSVDSTSARSPSAGATVVGGGRPDVAVSRPSASQTVTAEAGIRSAVEGFLADVAGWRAASCTCAVALAVSVGGNAHATATPLRSGFAPGIAGQSGDAVSVGFSGDGPATATASSGGVGNAGEASVGGDDLPPAQQGQVSTAPSDAGLAAQIRELVAELIDANGQTESGLDPLRGDPKLHPATSRAIAVEVTSTGPLDQCASLRGCAVAIGISVAGQASADLNPTRPCGGPVGGATAVAVSVAHDAHASADIGRDGRCPTSSSARHAVVSAVAGDTGAAYGVSLATDGPSRAAAQSGHLGTTVTKSDADAAAPEAVSMSGSTGDSAGIAIGVDAADSAVRTGDSGDAAAQCVRCAQAAGGTSLARSGDTGSSYGLAAAGLTAAVTATTGGSGDTTANSYGLKAAASGKGATVRGRSGDTGNAFAVAVDLDTWVTVTAYSGGAGEVISIAKGPRTAPGKHGSSTVRPSGTSGSHVGRGHPSGRGRHARVPAALIAAPGATDASRPTAARQSRPHVRAPSSAPAPPDTSLVDSRGAVAAVPSIQGPAPQPTASRVDRANGAGMPRAVSALGLGLVGFPAVLLSLAALVAAVAVRRRRRGRP